MAVAVAAVASLAPCGVEGFDYYAGMGELNAGDIKLFFSDPEAARRKHHEEWEEAAAEPPEHLAETLKSLLSPVDAEALTGELAQWLADSGHDGLAAASRAGGTMEWHTLPAGDSTCRTSRVPVKIWHGRQDRFVPVQHGQWLAANVPGAQADISDRDGHLTMIGRRHTRHGWDHAEPWLPARHLTHRPGTALHHRRAHPRQCEPGHGRTDRAGRAESRRGRTRHRRSVDPGIRTGLRHPRGGTSTEVPPRHTTRSVKQHRPPAPGTCSAAYHGAGLAADSARVARRGDRRNSAGRQTGSSVDSTARPHTHAAVGSSNNVLNCRDEVHRDWRALDGVHEDASSDGSTRSAARRYGDRCRCLAVRERRRRGSLRRQPLLPGKAEPAVPLPHRWLILTLC
jgi:hypothetical protein